MTKKAGLILSVLFMLATVIAVQIGLTHYRQLLAQPLAIEQPQLLTILPGDNLHKLLKQFADKGWLDAPLAAKLWLKLNPTMGDIKVGTYRVSPGQSLPELAQLLKSGNEAQFSISLIDGMTWQQFKAALKAAAHLQQDDLSYATLCSLINDCRSGSLEGLLLADTYAYTANSKASSLVVRAYQAMQRFLNHQWPERQLDLPLASPYQALILASIVEKETGLASERAQIAQVFVNRLRLGMRLQTDPTVIYGMGDAFDGNIRRRDLRQKTPYNTYVIKGLPPTPIAMPGKAAILASLQPQATNALYFVARGDGSHQFSETLAEHNAAVRRYQLKGK